VHTEFRDRLTANGQAQRLLGLMLGRLRESGLLVSGGRQRTDATHVVMAVRDSGRLEQVTETLRAALEVLAVVAPAWLAGFLPDGWAERYGQRADNWRLPRTDHARAGLGTEIGADGHLLLETIYSSDCPAWLAEIEAVQVLRQTWVQRYYRVDASIVMRDKDLGVAPGSVMILSPYDIDARTGIKRGQKWRGYKGHFTETCEPDMPHLIVHVATTAASTADVETVAQRHDDLAAASLLPAIHLVDAGYISVEHVLAARDEHDVELIGPLPPASGWQALAQTGFGLSHFTIEWDRRKVVCPNKKVSRNWRKSYSREGLPVIQVIFRVPDCVPCPDRSRCTRSADGARGLTFRPQRQYEAQQHIRAEQSTTQWRDRYAHRSGVESLIPQASRRSGIHRIRYPGRAKTFLQHTLTAMAINLTRIDAWLTGTATTGCWTSRLTQLSQSMMAT
jgi:hypothetical protein